MIFGGRAELSAFNALSVRSINYQCTGSPRKPNHSGDGKHISTIEHRSKDINDVCLKVFPICIMHRVSDDGADIFDHITFELVHTYII